ncbi:MAG: RluA family pseudouridine synthase [Treponema sp.]|nr:RluA family pseudouridine synthase [Treponema sp.]
MPSFSALVPENFESEIRLDKYMASISDGMNRSKLKSGFTQILLNGKNSKLSAKVKAGDKIEIQWEENIPTDIVPENIPLNIIYEDENVTVVSKAVGMVTHPANGNWSGTLVNALLYHWGREAFPHSKDATSSAVLSQMRPGIVHRLDKDTSGIIITAKNRDSEEWLHGQFSERSSITKEYIAICTGVPKILGGKIETQIVRDPKNRKRFKAVTGTTEGKFARTIYKVIATYGPYSLIRLRIKTGRTHQIRVHMKYLGCPILGDPIYGKRISETAFKNHNVQLMLHAFFLRIRLPNKTENSVFKTKTPVRFKKVIYFLRKSGFPFSDFTKGNL